MLMRKITRKHKNKSSTTTYKPSASVSQESFRTIQQIMHSKVLLTQRDVLQMQSAIGNQATLKLLNQGGVQQKMNANMIQRGNKGGKIKDKRGEEESSDVRVNVRNYLARRGYRETNDTFLITDLNEPPKRAIMIEALRQHLVLFRVFRDWSWSSFMIQKKGGLDNFITFIETNFELGQENFTGVETCDEATKWLFQHIHGAPALFTIHKAVVEGDNHWFLKTASGVIIDGTWKQFFIEHVPKEHLAQFLQEPAIFVGKLPDLIRILQKYGVAQKVIHDQLTNNWVQGLSAKPKRIQDL